MNIGWTQVDMDTYVKGHYHLVNQLTANMVKDNEPDVPDPGDLEWLTSHPAVAGTGKAPRTQMRAGQKKRKARKIQTRNCGIERNKKVSKVIRTTYTTNAVSKTGKGDSSGPQSVCAFPKWCDIGFAGIRRGLSGGIVGRLIYVLYMLKE